MEHIFVGLPKVEDFMMGYLSENTTEGLSLIKYIQDHLEKRLATRAIFLYSKKMRN